MVVTSLANSTIKLAILLSQAKPEVFKCLHEIIQIVQPEAIHPATGGSSAFLAGGGNPSLSLAFLSIFFAHTLFLSPETLSFPFFSLDIYLGGPEERCKLNSGGPRRSPAAKVIVIVMSLGNVPGDNDFDHFCVVKMFI